MSFYRTVIAAVAAMGLGFATTAFAADDADMSGQPEAKAIQTADATNTNTTATTNDQNQNMQQTTDNNVKVNVNTATTKELMQIKGMSAARAKAIVSYRKKHGDFKSLDELKDVKGFKKMSEKSMKKMMDQMTIG